MRTTFLLFVCIVSTIGSLQAEIFTCKDANGNTIYADTPQACVGNKAEEVKVDTLPTLIQSKSLPSSTGTSSSQLEQREDKEDYQALNITNPSQNQTLRSNEGNVTISFQSTPALRGNFGHRYAVALNGKEIYRGKGTSVSVNEADRGVHKVTAKIVTANGRTLATAETVEFFLQRFSALQGSDGDGLVPGGQSPVPGSDTPAAGGDAPIPGGTAPIPGGSAPIPGGTAPIPGATPPSASAP